MPNEEPPSYKFRLIGGHENLYKFETKNGVEYDVRFKPNADYVPPEEPWRDELYEIVIDVASAPDPARIPADRVIFPTIVVIIADFFANHQRVILYICDDSDSKELARKRKFDGWYARSGDFLFEKHDLPTVAIGPERYFASVFFRRDNPNRFAIIAAFDRLGASDK